MRLWFSNASLHTRTVTALVLVACLSGIGIGIATQTGGAVTKAPSGPNSETAHTVPARMVDAILYYAESQAGDAYCFGGGGINGPTEDPTNPPNPGCARPTKGYDCMSLAQYAVYQGTGHTVKLPADGSQPKRNGKTIGTFIPPNSNPSDYDVGLKPGDVTFWGGTINDYHHSAIYAGVATSGRFKGQPVVWDALDNNIPVQEHTMGNLIAEGYTYEGAYRYSAGTVPVLTITTTSLPAGTVYSTTHKSYSATLHAAAGHPPYRWSLAPGSKPLPPGLTVGSTGVISGEATRKGAFPFVVQAVDTRTASAAKQTADRTLTIQIT